VDRYPAIDVRAGRVARLPRGDAGIVGLGIGRALPEGRLTLREALTCSSSR